MKTLVVSIKSPEEALNDFKSALSAARKQKRKQDHFEISFDNKKDFDRFAKNIALLSTIIIHKPKSVYELAKIAKMDVSNLNKIILFLEEVGAIKIRESTQNGRKIKTPLVEYKQIQIDLSAA
ncbi:hypothetical protein EZJ49_12050 [Bdellovibrio bacteriovorus]|uniref:HVO_A0114 family putative DNA-binding protein n=1 Tax=Bdellovibrio bacteriovorus TaxID=959 RepID=UPI0021CEAE98|nr:hypothetical protein [Bdellovibrio bacteriovorus]UXR63794.1 hypothetical protein EZJ49_12050 [Bdellovibrio bacteriovorus]